jgi:hypothetical protein
MTLYDVLRSARALSPEDQHTLIALLTMPAATLDDLPLEAIRNYCVAQPIRRLSVFGSVLRADFGPHSDLDLLVEYTPGVPVTLADMAQQELDLAQIVKREVDLRTASELSPYFRPRVVATSVLIYER